MIERRGPFSWASPPARHSLCWHSVASKRRSAITCRRCDLAHVYSSRRRCVATWLGAYVAGCSGRSFACLRMQTDGDMQGVAIRSHRLSTRVAPIAPHACRWRCAHQHRVGCGIPVSSVSVAMRRRSRLRQAIACHLVACFSPTTCKRRIRFRHPRRPGRFRAAGWPCKRTHGRAGLA